MIQCLIVVLLIVVVFVFFGDVFEVLGVLDKVINQGMCGCYYDLVELDFGDGCVGISLFDVKVWQFFYIVDMVEWYLEGSQVFVLFDGVFMLVIVVEDWDGVFVNLKVFFSGLG